MNKKLLGIILILIAVLSIILSIVAYSMDVGSTRSSYTYGGDAYTGIQNASAGTANNLYYLSKIVKFGFGSVLLVTGTLCATVGVYYLKNAAEDKLLFTHPAPVALPDGDKSTVINTVSFDSSRIDG